MEHGDRSRGQRGRRRAGRLTATVVGAGLLAVTFAASAGATTTTTVTTAKSSKGTVLAAEGNTLYSVKTKKACDAKCHKTWSPALLPQGVTAASASGGVDASKLGTTSSEGGLQITYDGKPLFWYAKDKASGQVKGNLSDKWGKWTAVVTKASSSSSGGSGGSGGDGNKDAGTGGIAF